MNERIELELNGKELGEVESFKYLGATMAADMAVKLDVSNRFNKWCKLLGDMKNIMKNREGE